MTLPSRLAEELLPERPRLTAALVAGSAPVSSPSLGLCFVGVSSPPGRTSALQPHVGRRVLARTRIEPCRPRNCLRTPLDAGLRCWCSLRTVQSIAVKLRLSGGSSATATSSLHRWPAQGVTRVSRVLPQHSVAGLPEQRARGRASPECAYGPLATSAPPRARQVPERFCRTRARAQPAAQTDPQKGLPTREWRTSLRTTDGAVPCMEVGAAHPQRSTAPAGTQQPARARQRAKWIVVTALHPHHTRIDVYYPSHAFPRHTNHQQRNPTRPPTTAMTAIDMPAMAPLLRPPLLTEGSVDCCVT